MQKKYDYIFKFVIVGSSSVGKSSILKRFADDEFTDTYISTIGIDFRFKSLTIDQNYLKLQIWDTAGQERFRGVTKSYYKGSQAILLVYDITNPKSFEDLVNFWIKECKNNSEDGKVYVLANKCDSEETELPEEQLKKLEEKGVEVFKVSAKTGHNVNESVIKIAKHMMEIHPKVSDDKLASTLRQSTNNKNFGKGNACCN